VIATYGPSEWEDTAYERAKPSAERQGADTIVTVHLKDGTLAEARNVGAEDAGGDWLVFLDADDELEDGYLDAIRLAEGTLERDTAGRRYEDGLLCPAVSHIAVTGRVSEAELPNRRLKMTWLNHCVIGTGVPARLFRKVGGFRDDLPIYEDWELWLRCIRAGAKIIDVPDAVYLAYDRPDSRNLGDKDAAVTYERIRAEHRSAEQ
jgi:glycosyltransferase involved in cell wall biosynthesis